MQTATQLTRRITTALPLLAAVLAAMPAQTRAANGTWTGNAVVDDGLGNLIPVPLWSNLANWSGGIPGAANPVTPSDNPAVGDTATFGAATNTAVSIGSITLNKVAFTGAAPAYSFTGSMTLSANGAVSVDSGAAAQTINPSAFLGSSTITNNSSNLLTLLTTAPTQTANSTMTFGGSGNITTTAALASANTAGLAIVKNGPGTLTLNASNSSSFVSLTVNEGRVMGNNANSFANKWIALGAGTTAEMTAANSPATNFGNGGTVAAPNPGMAINGNTTLFFNQASPSASNRWILGASGVSTMTSSNSPTVLFKTAISGARIAVQMQTQNFDGTWKLGDHATVTINHPTSSGSANLRMDMGDAASVGVHTLRSGTSSQAQTGTVRSIVPIVLGELRGTNTSSMLAGREGVGTQTTGTQYLVGGLGTSTTYSGRITDGISNNGTGDGASGSVTLPDGSTITSNYALSAGMAGSQATTEFVKTGAGTLTLTNTNTHTGGTVIQGGRLAVTSDSALGAAYTGQLRPFSLIPYSDVGGNVNKYVGGTLPTAVLTGGNPAVAATVGVFSSASPINDNTLFLAFGTTAGASSSVGSGYVSVPTLSFTGGSDPDSLVGSVRVKGLLTLDGGTLQTDAGITSNRAVVVTSAGGTIDTNGFDSTLSGVINGSGDLTKAGNGILTLTGDNTLTGLTTVAGGVLNLEGTLAGSVTVNAGASLTGDGTAGSATILGTIAPGNSIGELNFGGPTTLSGTAMIELDAAGAPNADLINVAGAVTLGGDLTVSWLSAPGPGTYNIIDATSFSGSFANVNLPALTGSLTWDTSQLNTAGILTVVPEPGSALLALLSGGLLLRRRRR